MVTLVISSASRTEDPGFESRQGVRILGLATLQCCSQNLIWIAYLFEKNKCLKKFLNIWTACIHYLVKKSKILLNLFPIFDTSSRECHRQHGKQFCLRRLSGNVGNLAFWVSTHFENLLPKWASEMSGKETFQNWILHNHFKHYLHAVSFLGYIKRCSWQSGSRSFLRVSCDNILAWHQYACTLMYTAISYVKPIAGTTM
jgi:hypothetical protein